MKNAILFIFLFILNSCGNFTSEANTYNKENEQEKDIAKSEKTTERFSESLDQKSIEMPKHLMSGFRKSSISDKINVTENSISIMFQEKFKNPLVEQENLNKKLSTLIDEKESNLPSIEEALVNGADPNALVFWHSMLDSAVRKKAAKTVALLLQFGAKPELIHANHESALNRAAESAPHLLPLLWGMISPQKILQFSEDTSAESFLQLGKSVYSRYLLLDLFVDLRSKFGKKIAATEENSIITEAPSRTNLFYNITQRVKTFAVQLHNQRKSIKSRFLLDQILDRTVSIDLEKEEQALKEGANPNYITAHRFSDNKEPLLMVAAGRNHFRMTALLLKYGADPKLGVNGSYPMNLMLKYPYNPIGALFKGEITPDEFLHIGEFDVQKALLERQENKDKYIQMVRYILLALNDLNQSADQLLVRALKEADFAKAEYALEMGASPTVGMYKIYPLHLAIQKKNTAIAQLLLQYGSDPLLFMEGITLREHALNAGMRELVEEMDKL